MPILKKSVRVVGANTAVVAQVGGSHYSNCAGQCPHCGGEIQHWDLFARMPYLEAQICRYVIRWLQKNGLEDLAKARSFLDKLDAVLKLPGPALREPPPPPAKLRLREH